MLFSAARLMQRSDHDSPEGWDDNYRNLVGSVFFPLQPSSVGLSNGTHGSTWVTCCFHILNKEGTSRARGRAGHPRTKGGTLSLGRFQLRPFTVTPSPSCLPHFFLSRPTASPSAEADKNSTKITENNGKQCDVSLISLHVQIGHLLDR